MGNIIKNGITYAGGGAGGASVIDITEAEYNALPESKLTDGKIYHITDKDMGQLSAAAVTLDVEGVEATNVNDGIEEIHGEITNLNSELNTIINAEYIDTAATTEDAITAWVNKYAPTAGAANYMGRLVSRDGHFHISAFVDLYKNSMGTVNQFNGGADNTLNYTFNCMGGASTVISPFSSGAKVYYLGTGTTFDIKTLCPNVDYTKLTANNFIVEPAASASKNGSASGYQPAGANSGYANAKMTYSKAYNASTGVLTTSLSATGTAMVYYSDRGGWTTHQNTTCSTTLRAYLVDGKIES